MQELSERKKLILSTIIDVYIDSGEPVGSRALTNYDALSFSSATIRNEMAELEELGYLEQPHTSSGRIPTEKGYRFYVDSLMKSYKLTSDELAQINSLAKNKAAELDSILERAGNVVSNLTNYTAMTVRRKSPANSVVQYKVIRVSTDTLLVIMLSASGNVISRYVNVEGEVDTETADRLEKALNDLLCDVDPNDITLPVMLQLQMRMTGYEFLISPVLKCIYEVHNKSDGADVRFEGVNRLLQYPEMRDADKLSGILSAFDDKTDLMNVVANADSRGVSVYIGEENSVADMKHTSLIFRPISAGGSVIGAIGVIGPCRMDYSKVVAAVDYLSQSIMQMLENADTNDK